MNLISLGQNTVGGGPVGFFEEEDEEELLLHIHTHAHTHENHHHVWQR